MMNIPMILNSRNDDSINLEEQNSMDLNYIDPINNWITIDSTQNNSFNKNLIFNRDIQLIPYISHDDSFLKLYQLNIFNRRNQNHFAILSPLSSENNLFLTNQENGGILIDNDNNSNFDDEK